MNNANMRVSFKEISSTVAINQKNALDGKLSGCMVRSSQRLSICFYSAFSPE